MSVKDEEIIFVLQETAKRSKSDRLANIYRAAAIRLVRRHDTITIMNDSKKRMRNKIAELERALAATNCSKVSQG